MMVKTETDVDRVVEVGVTVQYDSLLLKAMNTNEVSAEWGG